MKPNRLRLRPCEPSEYQTQVSLVETLRKFAAPGTLFFHIPNQTTGGARRGAFLKRMGARAGVADLFVMRAGRVLFLELKDSAQPQSDSQKAFQAASVAAGAEYLLVRGLDEAIRELTAREYIGRQLLEVRAVAFLARLSGQCAWPLWSDATQGEKMVCGAAVIHEACSYCAWHARVAWKVAA